MERLRTAADGAGCGLWRFGAAALRRRRAAAQPLSVEPQRQGLRRLRGALRRESCAALRRQAPRDSSALITLPADRVILGPHYSGLRVGRLPGEALNNLSQQSVNIQKCVYQN